MTNFRCLSCGVVKGLDLPATRLHVRPDRDGEPPCLCGGLQWVQVGSTTEFYRFWNRADVCRPGAHVAEGVREFVIEPPPSATVPGARQVTALYERACPAHVARLHAQWPGANIWPVEAQTRALDEPGHCMPELSRLK